MTRGINKGEGEVWVGHVNIERLKGLAPSSPAYRTIHNISAHTKTSFIFSNVRISLNTNRQ